MGKSRPNAAAIAVSFRVQVGGENFGAGALGQGGQQDADGALADDQHRLIRGRDSGCGRPLGRYSPVRRRLPAQRGRRQGSCTSRRARTIQSITRTYSAKPPPEGSKPGGAAYLLINRTLGKGFLAAVVASRRRGCGGRPLTRSPTANLADARSHGRDDAHRLVAEDARRGVGAGMDLLQVGAADSAASGPAMSTSPGPIAGTGTVSTRTSFTPR